jgi:hypothetical protein
MNGINRPAPSVHVIRFITSERPQVQAFIDVEIDGWLRLNGLNLLRDGSIKPGQLTPLIAGRRCHIDSVQVIDGDLRESLTAAILAAIRAHLEKLKPEERMKPPQPSESRQMGERPAAVIAREKPQSAASQAKPAPAAPPRAPTNEKLIPLISAKPPAEKPKLPPPVRLLASFPRRTL